MTLVETNTEQRGLTFRQRWSHYFVLIYGILSLVIAVNLRISRLNAVSTYINNEVGIVAQYPENWLIDEGGTDYVFRVRNVSEIGFKTTYQVAVQPIGAFTTDRNILDALSLSRAQTLDAYRVFAIDPYTLAEELVASAASYTYVAGQANPFLESIPTVVTGVDIITIQRGQAIIITLLSDAQSFDTNFERFEQFVRQLEF